MGVYVDAMMACVPNEKWRYTENCHLIADSERELLVFAMRMGLKPEWLQRGTLVHFDLTRGKRAQAVRMGAVELAREQMVERIRAARPRLVERLEGDVQ